MAMVSNQPVNQVPTFDELMNPTLRALRELGGSASIEELLREVTRDLNLPLEVTSQTHLGGPQTELAYRLAWTRTYLKKFGLIDNSQRGVWSLTRDGHATQSVDQQVVSRSVREAGNSRDFRNVEHSISSSSDELPDDDSSLDTATWRDELLERLKTLDPGAFERLCSRILRESGFIEVKVTGRPGDGGIDGNGIIRLAGLISFPVIFQCKRYSGNVTAGAVRDFRGAMQGRADKGLILTTGGFTMDARREATRDGAPPVDLIDGGLLVSKMRELGLGLNSRTVEIIEVDTQWFESI